MLTELERKLAWEGWFSSEVCALYFAELSGVYRRWQTVATWLTLLFSSGTLASALARLRDEYAWMAPALAMLTTALSLYSVVAHNHQKMTDCADLHFRWSRLASDYRALWGTQHDDTATMRLDDLEVRRAEVSKAGTAFPDKPRRIQHWYKHVKDSLAYATA